MPRKALKQEIQDAVVHLSNGPKPEDYQSFVERIEFVQRDIDAADARHKENKAPFKSDMKEIYEEAKSLGISKAALRHVVGKRRKLLKAKEAFEKLDLVDRSEAVSIELALGPFLDTELGQAAVEAARQ